MKQRPAKQYPFLLSLVLGGYIPKKPGRLRKALYGRERECFTFLFLVFFFRDFQS